MTSPCVARSTHVAVMTKGRRPTLYYVTSSESRGTCVYDKKPARVRKKPDRVRKKHRRHLFKIEHHGKGHRQVAERLIIYGSEKERKCVVEKGYPATLRQE